MNQLEDIIKILDSMAENEVSRIKVEMSNFINPGETQKYTITGDVTLEVHLQREISMI